MTGSQPPSAGAAGTGRWPDTVEVEIGGRPRGWLREELRSAGVSMNPHAQTLLEHPVFDEAAAERVRVVVRSVQQLGLDHPATMSRVVSAAAERGLGLCPAVTGPYLRLAWTTQPDSTDSVLSAGRSPDGAVNVAAPQLSDDVDYPRGFYLRAVEGRLWLRGFRCDDLYEFAPDVRFAFRLGD